MSSKIDHSYNTTDGRLICNILRQKDRRHPINYWERTSRYIHRQSIWWKVRNIQTPGHKWRHEPNSEGSTETMRTWSDSNVVVEGLHWSAGTIHHLRLQYLTILRVRTQQFQRRLHHSFTEEEWAGRNRRGELQTSFQPVCTVENTRTRCSPTNWKLSERGQSLTIPSIGVQEASLYRNRTPQSMFRHHIPPIDMGDYALLMTLNAWVSRIFGWIFYYL